MSDENGPEFSLMKVLGAIESASEDVRWFANTQTGEVDCYIDSGISGEDYDEGAFEGVGWIALPGSYDRDDWRIMRGFAHELGGPVGEEMLDAIHGSGAFRSFRRIAERAGLAESWHAYRDARLCEIAVEWLEGNGCTWADDRHKSLEGDWRALLPDALKAEIRLSVAGGAFSVCKLGGMPEGLFDGGFCCMVKTADEVSLVCETARAPEDAVAREDGWRALKVHGPLEFGLVGILAKITSALAEADVPLFAISTFDTDYILVKEGDLETAVAALRRQGCEVDGGLQEVSRPEFAPNSVQIPTGGHS